MNKTSLRRFKSKETGITAFGLKLIAVLTMVTDHTGAGIIILLPEAHNADSAVYMLYWIMRIVGRMAMPVFLFLVVEGVIHSRNRLKYALRLFIFGLISEVPYDLCFKHTWFYPEDQNVMFTLCIGVLVLTAFDHVGKISGSKLPDKLIKAACLIIAAPYFAYIVTKFVNKNSTVQMNLYVVYGISFVCCEVLMIYIMNRYFRLHGNDAALRFCLDLVILAAGMGLADLIKCDYSSTGVLALAMMYANRKTRFKEIMSGIVVLIVLSNPLELIDFLLLPVLMRYNGHKGASNQRAMYLVYPVHMLIIYIIVVSLGLVQGVL